MEEELMKLGLDEEAARIAAEYIDENYGDIESLKKENQRLMEEAENGNAGQYGRLKQEYDDLQSRYDSDTESLRGQLTSRDREYAVDKALTGAGCRNEKAVRALMNMDGLTMQDGKLAGLEEMLEQVKAEAPYLFEECKKQQGYRPVNHKTKRESNLKRQIYSGLRGE